MNVWLRFFLSIALLGYFAIIYILLKNKKLQLKYTLLWLVAGVIMVVILMFSDYAIQILHRFGIIDTNVGVLAIVAFMMLIILMSITSVLSKLDFQKKRIIQQLGLLEKRVRDLEKQNKKEGNIDV